MLHGVVRVIAVGGVLLVAGFLGMRIASGDDRVSAAPIVLDIAAADDGSAVIVGSPGAGPNSSADPTSTPTASPKSHPGDTNDGAGSRSEVTVVPPADSVYVSDEDDPDDDPDDPDDPDEPDDPDDPDD